MNVDGAFILPEICRNREDLSAYVCWPQHADISQIYLITNLGRCLSHISHCHTPLIFFNKNKQMASKCFSTEFPRDLKFEPWCCERRARAALFEYMPFVHVLENITFCSLFANPFCDFNHHRNQQQAPLPLLIGDMRSSAKQSLAVGVLCL